jgi:YjbE family integral membrane protein
VLAKVSAQLSGRPARHYGETPQQKHDCGCSELRNSETAALKRNFLLVEHKKNILQGMNFLSELQTPAFWESLMLIIWINIILSGDNAVVIALASRSLPPDQQKKAVRWGAGGAVVLRILLTAVAFKMLHWPYLKIVGGLLLLWIAIGLLVPNKEEEHVDSPNNLLKAIKAVLIADLVMSLDNVLAVAGVAKDSVLLLVIGLAVSIPLVVFGATMLMKLMKRFPVIITAGAGVLGWVAGEMLITDPSSKVWIEKNLTWMHINTPIGGISWSQIVGAAMVIVVGKALAARKSKGQSEEPHSA